MIAFLEMLDDKYGGVNEYCKKYLKCSQDDLSKIHRNLLTNAPAKAGSDVLDIEGIPENTDH